MKVLHGMMALVLSGFMAVNAMATEPANKQVQEVEKALFEQIGEMPKLNNGENLGALVISLTNPYWVGLKDAYEAAAKEYGVSVTVLSAPTEGDKQSQLEALDTMVVKDYDAIVFSPIEPFNLLPAVLHANEAKIPVINLGPGINIDELEKRGGHLDGRITVDFSEQGRMAARDMVSRIGSGEVAIIKGIVGAAQSEGRTAGASEIFTETKGVDLVSVQPADWDSTKAYNIAADLVQAHPNLKGIFCCNDVMALAVSRALVEAGVKEQVLVYGVDFIEQAKVAIAEGRMDGTVAYPSSAYAKAAIVMALKLAQDMPLPKAIYSPLQVVNSANVSEFEGYR